MNESWCCSASLRTSRVTTSQLPLNFSITLPRAPFARYSFHSADPFALTTENYGDGQAESHVPRSSWFLLSNGNLVENSSVTYGGIYTALRGFLMGTKSAAIMDIKLGQCSPRIFSHVRFFHRKKLQVPHATKNSPAIFSLELSVDLLVARRDLWSATLIA